MITSSSQERKQGPYTPLSAAAQGLVDKGVSIYVIGIGDKVKVPELMELSSDYRNLFVADDFSTVRSRGNVVTEIIKNGTEDSSRGKLKLIGYFRVTRLCVKTGLRRYRSYGNVFHLQVHFHAIKLIFL